MKPVTDVLYVYTPERKTELLAEIQQAGGRDSRGPKGDICVVYQSGGTTLRLLLVDRIEQALKLLADHYFNFVVVDSRLCSDCQPDGVPLASQFMHRIHYSADPDKRYPLSRIIAVLPDDDQLASHAFEFGRLRIGGFVTAPFAGHLVALMDRLYDPGTGKTALCLSGGGIEGFLYELGVTMALNSHLQTRSVTDFDIFCGISAGSIVAAFLANLTEPEELIDELFRDQSNENALTPDVIYDFNMSEYLSRLWSLTRNLPLLSGTELFSSLLRSVPTGFFRGKALSSFVEANLKQSGRSDDFRRLQRELYIGATDQDRGTHVVFGDGQWADVPISQAVRASTALVPFFGPARIEDRLFVDGQYTRTSNFHVAVEKGARLVIVINPLVPVKVENTGYVQKKGGIYGALQGLKAVIHTRFLHAFQAAVDAYPEVDFILFEPEGELVRLMGGSPMKYNLRTEIVNVAYRLAVQRIQRDFDVLEGTMNRHGFRMQRHPRLRTEHHVIV